MVNQLKSILATYPNPAPYGGWKNEKSAQISPKIANKTLTISAEVEVSDDANDHGVVIAQGGNQQGYSLHFIKGVPAFDVRINGKVTRLKFPEAPAGRFKLQAILKHNSIELSIGEEFGIRTNSPGFIPSQPLDSLSVGYDSLSAAGDYDAPNPFSGKVLSHNVVVGSVPKNKLPNIVLFVSDDLGLDVSIQLLQDTLWLLAWLQVFLLF